MLILAVDTSGNEGSIALVRFDAGEQHTIDVVPIEGGTFSAQLVPQIAALLHKHHLSKRDIDAFAVASGPGSFTGLRVGLAAIKALAETMHKPIAAVSLLEAVARASRDTHGRVVSVLDAGRGEVYVGTFDVARDRVVCVSEELKTLRELSAQVGGQQLLVTPDQKLAEAFLASDLPVTVVEAPRADTIARLGFERIQRGEVVAPEALDATYIRRSDAEIKLSR